MRPGDGMRFGDAALREPGSDAADFLNGPADWRRATKIPGIVCWAIAVLAVADRGHHSKREHNKQNMASPAQGYELGLTII